MSATVASVACAAVVGCSPVRAAAGSYQRLQGFACVVGPFHKHFPFCPVLSRYTPTYEMYASQAGDVEWEEGPVVLAEGAKFRKVVYGVFQDTLANYGGADGVIFGLIRNKNDDIRPSFLEQTNVRSFRLDFVNQVPGAGA